MSVRISPLFVIAVAAVVVTASVGVYFLMSDNERYDITIAWADKDCYEPFWIADKMGFWNDEGVKVKGVRVANGSEVASAILSGTADCGGMGADPLLRMLRDDDNASIICRYQAGSSHSEFVARDGANGGKISRSVYQSFFAADGKPIDGKKAEVGGIEMGLKEYLKYALTGADVGMHMGTAYWSWFLGFLENIDLSLGGLGDVNDIAF
ncbi:MAG: hypothetical protein FWG19_01805, partial [Methanomassiliicoccaceae archaeon]|nr:hypothetical protein [Methanomassiliicoccaceae archaeon]